MNADIHEMRGQPEMHIHLRRARRSDVAALEGLIAESFRGLGSGHYSQRQIDSGLRHIAGVDTDLIDDGTFFAAEAGGSIVACGGWSRRRRTFGSPDNTPATDGELLDLAADAAGLRSFYVRPRWARRGLGSRIYRRCEAEARAAGFTRLRLVATGPGEPLYTALGFRVLGRTEFTCPDGVTLVGTVMEKDLDAPPSRGRRRGDSSAPAPGGRFQSWRNVEIGSTRVARRAGT